MAFQSGYAGEYEGHNRLELIQMVLRGLGSVVTTDGTDTTSDYSRYPKADIIRQLNQAEIDFVLQTDALTTWAVIEAVADRREYRLPRRCMKVIDAKYYTSDTTYEQLYIKTNMDQMKRVDSTWRVATAGRPEIIYPAYGYGNTRSFGAYPVPSSDGTTFTGTSFGIVTSGTDFTFTGNIDGAHKTGYANSAFYVDGAGRDMSALGVVVGMMIFNTTDGSSGQITAIGNQDATNDKISVTLSGGTDDDFDVADSIVITVGEYGVVVRSTNSEEWAFSSDYGAIQDISPLSGNFLVDFVKRPLKLDIDTQFPEIPPEYHYALAERAIWKLGNHETNGKVVINRAMEGKEEFMKSIEHYRMFSVPELEDDGTIEDREGLFLADGYRYGYRRGH
jgi:hypothetical protein